MHALKNRSQFVLSFSLEDTRYALPLDCVDRVVRSVEITPLPDAPEVILGVINVRGRIIAVADLRRRFRLPPREITLEDKLIIAHTARRSLAVVADEVYGVSEHDSERVAGVQDISDGVRYVAGIVKTDEGVILIHDLDTFLATEDELSLQRALENA